MKKCKKCDYANDDSFSEKCGSLLENDVFISYSRKDYIKNGEIIKDNIILKIKEELTKYKISYWFDEDGIYSGDEFASVITKAIRNSKLLLFVSSKNSNESIWTSNEISTALLYEKTIIPIRIDESPYNDSILMKIISLDRIDCVGRNIETILSRLIKSIYYKLQIKEPIEETYRFNVNRVTENVITPTTDKIEIISSAILDENLSSKIFIADHESPLAVLIGPPSIGKTMILVRLSRFLHEEGYIIQPDCFFRPSHDTRYLKTCRYFEKQLLSPFASTSTKDSLLVNIYKSGSKKLQMIDMPGEIFFDPLTSKPHDLTPLISTILSTNVPHIWIIVIELGWKDLKARKRYIETIQKYYKLFGNPDKVIILCNKIDNQPYMLEHDSISIKDLIKYIRNEYPELLPLFENKNPITHLFFKYNCTILPFSTGSYSKSSDNNIIYIPSVKDFPLRLWKELQI